MSRQMLPAPPLVQSVLNSLTMDCDYKDKGCSNLIPMERFASHMKSCDYRPAKCPHEECKLETTVHGLPQHKESCRHRKETCNKICGLEFPFYKLEKHDCVTALKERVQELTKRVVDHQTVLRWMRLGLNRFHMPHERIGMQLRAYHKMVNAFNLYWPPDQAVPVGLVGPVISVPSASKLETSTTDTNEFVLEGNNSLLQKIAMELSSPGNDQLVVGPHFLNTGGLSAPRMTGNVHSIGTAVARVLIPYETNGVDGQEGFAALDDYSPLQRLSAGIRPGHPHPIWSDSSDDEDNDTAHNYDHYRAYPDFPAQRNAHPDARTFRPVSRNFDVPGPSNGSPRYARITRSRSGSASSERSRSYSLISFISSPSIVYNRSRSASHPRSGDEGYDDNFGSRSRAQSQIYNRSHRSNSARSRSGSPNSYSTRSRSGSPNSRIAVEYLEDPGYSQHGYQHPDPYRSPNYDPGPYRLSPSSQGGNRSSGGDHSYDPEDDVHYSEDREDNIWDGYGSHEDSYRSPDPQDEGEWSQEDEAEPEQNGFTDRQERDGESDNCSASGRYSNSPSWTPSSYSRENAGNEVMSDTASSAPQTRSVSSSSSSSSDTLRNLSIGNSHGGDRRYSYQQRHEKPQSRVDLAADEDQDNHDRPSSAEESPPHGETSHLHVDAVKSIDYKGMSQSTASFSSSTPMHDSAQEPVSPNSDAASSNSSPQNSRSWRSRDRKERNACKQNTNSGRSKSQILCHNPTGKDDRAEAKSDHETSRGLWETASDTTSLDYDDSPGSFKGKERTYGNNKNTEAEHRNCDGADGGASKDRKGCVIGLTKDEDEHGSEDANQKSSSERKNPHSKSKRKSKSTERLPDDRDSGSTSERGSNSDVCYKRKKKQQSDQPYFHGENNSHATASAVDDNQPSTSGKQHVPKQSRKKGSDSLPKKDGKSESNCRKRKHSKEPSQEQSEEPSSIRVKKRKVSPKSSLRPKSLHNVDTPVVHGETSAHAAESIESTPAQSARLSHGGHHFPFGKSRSRRSSASLGSAVAEAAVEEPENTNMPRTASPSAGDVDPTIAGSTLHRRHQRRAHHARPERNTESEKCSESTNPSTGRRIMTVERSRAPSRRILHAESELAMEHTGLSNQEEVSEGRRGHTERDETGQRGQRVLTSEQNKSRESSAVENGRVPPVLAAREECESSRGTGFGHGAQQAQGSHRRVTCGDGGRETRGRHETDRRGLRLVTIEDLPVRPSTLQLLDIYTAYNEDETDSTWSPPSSSSESNE